MIEMYSFGKMVIDGKTYTKDLKIIGGKTYPDWFRKSGHLMVIDDIRDILETKPDTIVVGKGSPGLMKVSEDLRAHLKSKSIRLIEESTESAVQTFNDLRDKEKVCAGFHLTC